MHIRQLFHVFQAVLARSHLWIIPLLILAGCVALPIPQAVPVSEPAEAMAAETAEVAYLTIEGSHGPEWHLRATDAKIIGGYGKENWGNLAYSGQNVVSVDGWAEVNVNSDANEGTMVATFTGTIRPAKDKEYTGEIRLEFDVFATEDAPAWREGGAADFIMIHGDTGQEAPLVPAVGCYLCTWGTGKLFVDDELVHEAFSHFMWTSIIRDENEVVWADEARTTHYTPVKPDQGIVARPAESQLHFVFLDPRVQDPDNYPPMAWFLKVDFDKVEDLSPKP
jgi:hypothetical protein